MLICIGVPTVPVLALISGNMMDFGDKSCSRRWQKFEKIVYFFIDNYNPAPDLLWFSGRFRPKSRIPPPIEVFRSTVSAACCCSPPLLSPFQAQSGPRHSHSPSPSVPEIAVRVGKPMGGLWIFAQIMGLRDVVGDSGVSGFQNGVIFE